MYCDYNALREYADILNKNFIAIEKSLDNFKSALEVSTSIDTWNTPTREYIFELYCILKDNFNIISNKFNNIIEYLNSVINNYSITEEQMLSAF